MFKHFHNNFSNLVTNPWCECEEVATCCKSDLKIDNIEQEEKSNFICPSHIDTEGELQMYDAYDSLNQVEYEHFVFPIDITHELVFGDDYQLEVSNHEYANPHFHREH